jgi:hypothetical protein
MGKTESILLCSDLHCGSSLALWPRNHRHTDGVHQLASYQEWLLDRWNEMVEGLPRLDAVIINGDLLDGENNKGSGRGCITSDPADQAQAAVVLLSALRKKCRQMWLTRGTPYHEGASHEGLELVGSELKCERWGAGNRYSDLVLERSWRGHIINATHHQTTGFIWALGAASRMAAFASVAEADKGLPRADVIVRSHTHTDGIAFVNGRWVIMTPCWSFVTPYAIKKQEYYRATATNALGAVLLTDTDGTLSVKPLRYVIPKGDVLPL